MLPVLRSSLLALLLAALPAAAAPPVPGAVFDTRDAEISITAAEQAEILAAEDHRYGLKDFHFLDSKAVGPEQPLLTNARVLEFLKTRASRLTDGLRAKQKAGTIAAEDTKLAATLYWTRASLLTQADIDFLRSLNPLVLNGPPAKPEDAAAPRIAAAGAGDELERQKQALYDRLKGSIEFVADGDPARAAVADRSLRRLLDSQTARELSEQLLAEGGKVKVRFVAVAGSGVVEENGRKIIKASAGNMVYKDGFINLNLNQDLLQTDPAYQGQEIASTMGHEMLGHGVLAVKADKARVLETNRRYRGDEAKAGMVGWLVDAELGGKLHNPHMWTYLRRPEDYYRNLHTNLPYYAGTFSVDEMSDPVSALTERRGRAQTALKALDEQEANWKAWGPRIDHFTAVHGLKPDDAKTLRQDITDSLGTTIPERRLSLQAIVKHEDELIKYFSTDGGKAQIVKMTSDAKKPYFADNERDLATLGARLQKLTDARKPEPFFPPVPGQLTWDDMKRMYQKDLKDHPEHWNK